MVRASVSGHDTAVYEVLSRAVADGVVVEIEHASASGLLACRAIEPVALFTERGAWYVSGWCRKAGGWRTFRLDRIRSATAIAEKFVLGSHGAPPSAWRALDPAVLPCARLRFQPGEIFSEREWPGACLRIGSVLIGVQDLRLRCIMTSYDPDTLVQDKEITRGIYRRFDGKLALDCFVIEGGEIAVGDAVDLVRGRACTASAPFAEQVDHRRRP